MSSYFDFYCNNLEQYGNHDTEQIRGTCNLMCPLDEIRLRERENLVHVLEVIESDSERRLVKSYSRSAADSNMTVPQHLRPYSVLRDTVEYLLFEVARRTDVPLSIVYDFIDDRLRAVRQDITIQRLSAAQCACLLEPMVRFYVYFGYRLYGLPLRDYDPTLNKKSLLECLKWFLNCCDNLDKSNGKVDELSDALSDLKVNGSHDFKYDRVLIESLYILCNLDDVHPMFRYINLPKDLKREPRLHLAYEVALANIKGNYIQVSKLLKSLCSLSYCALCLHLPSMQRHALIVLSHAYNNKHLTVPSSVLRRWLSFSSDWEARGVCQHYGLALDERAVRFDKGEFKRNVPLHTSKIQLMHDGRLNLNMQYVFTYKH